MENKILATIGERTITSAAVDYVIKNIDPQSAQYFSTEPGRKQILNDLICQELMYLDAIDSKLNEEEEYLKALEDFKASILKQYAINKLMRSATVSDEEMKKYYDLNSEKFGQPAEVKASHILVKSEDEIKEVVDSLKEGMAFEDAANEYSTCPSNLQGGDLGYFGRGAMVPEFDEAVFAMENIGDISDPIKTQFGYHIIKLTDKKESQVKNFEDAKDEIYNLLVGKKQQELYLKNAETLKAKYPVTMVE